MIALVTGNPGHGKSYYCARKIATSLEDGKLVATNVALNENWAELVANSNWLRWLIPGRRRKCAAQYRQRCFLSGDLDDLFRVRLAGKGEGRGVMVLDEAHGWMNSRNWNDGDRMKIVRFFTQHRKLGWDVYLITQDANNIDRQVRTLFEYHIHLKNLRKFRLMGLPIFPMNLFLAIWGWHDGAKSIVKREAYRLTRLCRMYDTMALSHGLEDQEDDPIHLPAPRALHNEEGPALQAPAPPPPVTAGPVPDGFSQA